MSAGDARHGRRDNGLVAAEYAAAGDVDPRVGEHLLDVLALDGIAAYLRPSTDLHPVTRSTSLPGRPTDRLYVDRAHLAAARDYLTRLTDEADAVDRADRAAPSDPTAAVFGRDSDMDDAWAKIVAGFDTDAPRRSWPDAEDIADGGAARQGGGSSWPPAGSGRVAPYPAQPDEPSLLDGLDTFGAGLPDADDEGYTPPAPPPVPRPSLPTVLGVVGIVGGLVIFLKPDLLPIAESIAMLLGFTAVVSGFGTLVWRLRPGDDDDDPDPDNGARV